MRTSLPFALILVVYASLSTAEQSKSTQPDDTSTAVIATMRSIRVASASGDLDTWKDLVAESCIYVEPTGRLKPREWHIPRKSTNTNVKATNNLTELVVRDHGDTAVLTYIETTKAQIGDNVTHSVVRFAETYKRSGQHWQMIASAETPIPQRQAIKLDPAIYNDFVGEYQLAPGVIGTVTRDGNRLLLKGTGWKRAYELQPLSRDTFFVEEFENTEITFVRDGNGKVIHQLSRSGGQNLIAKKVK